MIPEDIEKLIGGYATGTLSKDERRKLFEAALDNQELFNVLHDEHALKELLDDPVSREMVRREAASSSPRTAKPWFRSGWIWGTAGAAVAAGLVLGLVLSRIPTKAPVYIARNDTAPPTAVSPAPAPPAAADRVEALPSPRPQVKSSRALAKKEVTAEPAASPKVAAAPPPVSSGSLLDANAPPTGSMAGQTSGVQTQPTQLGTGHNQLAGGQAPMVAQFRQEQSQMAAVSEKAGAGSPQASLLRTVPSQSIFYSISRKMPNDTYLSAPVGAAFQPGETIRLTIYPRTAGPLSLWLWDAANPAPKRVFPAGNGEAPEVKAMENYVLPVDIQVTAGLHLRVVVGANDVGIALPVSTK